MKKILGFTVIIFFLIACSDSQSVKDKSLAFQLKKIDPSHTGIDFVNALQEDISTKENLFDFDYFYNGAGVAAVDINNDDLPDLLFTANQGANKLYVNKGNFRFQDITRTSGINKGKQWSNGVTIVDINQDGWTDLYISQGGPHESADRKNLLYINNGDLTFTEDAASYGLDDQGISTQSAFFDYDRDGDLDCIVMNESLLYGHDPVSFQRSILERPKDYYESFSHLYRNDDGQYIDVSKEAGIIKPTFGLGLAISDINDDGYPDIYIANDYYLPDNLYINKKNGTFSDRIKTHLNQVSFYGMGVDIADINNDGYQDIYVLDMASQDHIRSKTLMASMDVASFNMLTQAFGFAHQYMFNSLQLNNQQGRFDNIAQMAQVAKTDWSWAALIEDIDLDGYRDIFVTNGYRKYALDNDFKARVNEQKEKYNGQVPSAVKQQLYDEMPTEPLPNILYRNNGNLGFNDIASKAGLDDATYSNGAILADLDSDGDLDMVVSNIDQQAMIYRNNASDINNYLQVTVGSSFNDCSKIEIKYKGVTQVYEPRATRGYRSAIEPMAQFGLSDIEQIDELLVYWTDDTKTVKKNVTANQRIVVQKADLIESQQNKSRSVFDRFAPVAIGLNHIHRENEYDDFTKEILLPQKQSTLGPAMTKADLNNDGVPDLYIGGSMTQSAQLYLSSNTGYYDTQQPSFAGTKSHEDIDAAFFDVDGDGDLDLYVVSGGNEKPSGSSYYQDRLYLNNGNNKFTLSSNRLPSVLGYSGGIVKIIDYDQDGDMDVFVGNRIIPQSYPVAAPSLLLNNDNGVLRDVTQVAIASLNDPAQIVNDVAVTDYDQDGDLDMMILGEWSGVRIFTNNDGVFTIEEKHNVLSDLTGWWYSIHEMDVNSDGIPDYVLGNVGKNIKHKASEEKPFKIYAEDFDETGSIDVVLTSHYKNEEVPVRGRECSSQQMPFITEKFETYNEFAKASIIDIYSEEKIDKAYQREVVTFESIILIGEGEGRFTEHALPMQAQSFPILDMVVRDINHDGLDDIAVIGNIYNTEVETPRLDNGSGLVLIANGSGNFVPGECPKYCFSGVGNLKKIEIINYNDNDYLLTVANDGPLSMFEIKD